MKTKRTIAVFVFFLIIVFLVGCRTPFPKESLVAVWDFETQIELYDGELIAEKNALGIDFSKWDQIKSVSAGGFYLGGIKEDGTVIITDFTGNDLDVGSWRNISMLELTLFSAYGLCEDGTIISSSMNTEFEDEIDKEVSSWSDIVYIDALISELLVCKEAGGS